MNTQGAWLQDFNLLELPEDYQVDLAAAEGDYSLAAQWIRQARRIVIKVGGGGRNSGTELTGLLERSGGALVHTPLATGCLPYQHPQNMGVGGSKGSLCGNYAMENADLLVAIGARAVCQSDCSRTGYPKVERVVNINADLEDATHYHHTLALVGDVRKTLERLNQVLGNSYRSENPWLQECAEKKLAWQALKQQRFSHPVLFDEYWGTQVLTQPAAIKIATDWARANEITCLFDAGDVQANGFHTIEDERPGQTFTETGASYMGFACSALLATGVSSHPFYALALTGDGSLTMNPQILIDGVEHGARGCILILDNGRMGAISGLQEAQYGAGFATWNTCKVDYITWGRSIPGLLALEGGHTPESLRTALDQAGKHAGLSLVHVPVYYGSDPLGGMGVYGRWNVGDWCEEVQALRHEIGL
jgi:3D-(3,5/4)-trihydroxycyclohexane-1,2-dione acylhydrolase (decyclizing)